MNRKSLGLIETIGLAAGIEAADAAVKSANVELIGYELTRGDGMATIKVEGDVGAVKAAVSAAEAAARKVGVVFSTRVIARPAQGLESLVRNRDTVGIKPATGKGPDGDGSPSPSGGNGPGGGSGPDGAPTTELTEAPKAEKPVVPAPEQQAKPPVVAEKPKPPAKEVKPVVKDTSTPAPEVKPAAEPVKEDKAIELEEAKPPVKSSKPAGKEPQTPAKPKAAKQEKKATKKSSAKGRKDAPKQPKGQAKPDAPKEKK